MDGMIDQQFLIDSSNHTQILSPELNKKRKLEHELTDSCSPISKQKIHNQQLMEEEEGEEEEEDSSENNTADSYYFKSETNKSIMNQDWPSTSSSSCNTNEISSNYSNTIDTGNNYNCKKNSYTELEGIYGPVIAELIMKNGIEGSDEEDQLSAFLYSNGLDEFTIPLVMQDGKVGVKEPTIDQEFEQYFSGLML